MKKLIIILFLHCFFISIYGQNVSPEILNLASMTTNKSKIICESITTKYLDISDGIIFEKINDNIEQSLIWSTVGTMGQSENKDPRENDWIKLFVKKVANSYDMRLLIPWSYKKTFGEGALTCSYVYNNYIVMFSLGWVKDEKNLILISVDEIPDNE